VAGERAPVVLAVEQPLDLPLRPLVDVPPVGIEEADLDGVRVTGGEPYGDATLRLAVADLEARERDGRELDVVDAHRGEVEPADDRPLQRAADPARVATRR